MYIKEVAFACKGDEYGVRKLRKENKEVANIGVREFESRFKGK